jgi:maltose alpha-D-glucosyltransferase/alpha-amylase
MENDRARIELISFLLMTLPGTPVLYYGDELGMGDNIYLGDRNGVRTPMQWSPDRNAGFSRADPQRLYLPPVMDPVYGYQSVNVEAQLRNGSSLLNWTRRLIAMRTAYKAFGRGSIVILDPGNRKVLAYLREWDGETLLCVANLARTPQAVELDLARYEGRVPVEVMGKESFPPLGRLPYMLTLPGHGYFAFRLATEARPPGWHEQRLPMRKLPILVLAESWRTFFTQAEAARDIRGLIRNATQSRLRDEILLPYLMERRWFAAKGRRIADVRLGESTEWITAEGGWLVSFLDVTLEDGPPQRYFFPLSIAWETRGYDPLETLGGVSFARVRYKDRVGAVYGAFANPAFPRALVRAMGEGRDMPFGRGVLRFSATARYPDLARWIGEEVRVPAMEQSNTGIYFGNKLYLKGYRRVEAGINPEVEVGRFLTEVSPYPNIAEVGGVVELVEADGAATALVLLQRFVENQGDAWSYTLDYLQRTVAAPVHEPQPAEEQAANGMPFEFYATQAQTLGERIGALHRAFALASGDPAFDPEPVSAGEIAGWRETVAADLGRTLEMLAQRVLSEALAGDAQRLVRARSALEARIRADTAPCPGLVKTRYHGDLHLGQVLRVQADFVIIDFEGEPARTLAERRRKHSPLRDVAGMMRSFSYAAETAHARLVADHAERAEPLRECVDAWESAARQAFLAGYRTSSAGVASVPPSPDALDQLVELFVIEKALYELRYELDNRPDWVGIPIRGLLRLVDA